MSTPKTAPKQAAPKESPVVKGKMQKDNDGTTAAGEEKVSVEKVTRATAAGKSPAELQKEWKQAVMQRLKDLKKTDEVNYLNQNNWLGDQKDAQGNLIDPSGQGQALDGNDAFSDLWQHGTPEWQKANPNANSVGVYQGYTWGHSSHNPPDSTLAGAMAGTKDQVVGTKKNKKTIPGRPQLMDDPAYQTITSVQRKHSDGTRQSPDPLTDNYAVGTRAGDLIKVTYPDGTVHYMPADDTNPGANLLGGKSTGDAGEMSASAMYGDKAGTQVSMQSVGRLKNPANGDYMTNAEWDEIGQNNYRNPDGTIPNTQDELKAARDKAAKDKEKAAPKPPPKTADAGGPKLLVGYQTVMHGADARNVGYAANASEHAAGGYMAEGSSTVFLGPEHYPLSRVGDGTSDGMVAVSGADDFFVGGAPMKA